MRSVKQLRLWEMVPYLSILIRPTIFGCIAMIIWYYIHPFTQVPKSDQDSFQNALAVIGIAHALIASTQIGQVYSKQQNIKLALKIRNKGLFEENMYICISPVMKLMLATFSFIIFYVFLLYPFDSVYTGCNMVWIVIFVLYLLWEVALEFENPYNGVWKVTREKVVKVFGEEILAYEGEDLFETTITAS